MSAHVAPQLGQAAPLKPSPAPPHFVCRAWMVSGLRVETKSRRVGPSQYKLGACLGMAPGWMGAPLHSHLSRRRAQKAHNAGRSPPQVFKWLPRQKGAKEWFGSKYPFLLPAESSAHIGLRALATGLLGHHVLAARHPEILVYRWKIRWGCVLGTWCSWWVIPIVVLLVCLFCFN